MPQQFDAKPSFEEGFLLCYFNNLSYSLKNNTELLYKNKASSVIIIRIVSEQDKQLFNLD